MISPGTEFIEILSKKLVEYIMEKKRGEWKHLEVHLSDATLPGEGEHKIMDFIRANKGKLGNTAIYGLDSDLIFLTLINCEEKCVLVRESVQFGGKFKKTRDATEKDYTYLSIDDLKRCILRVLSPLVSMSELEGIEIFNDYGFKVPRKIKTRFYTGSKRDNQRLIMDYAFFSFLLGNDFIPNLPSLIIKENGLDMVIQAYKIISWYLGDYLVRADGVSINQRFFRLMLNELKEIEEDFLIYSAEQREIRVAKFKKRLNFTKDRLKRELDDFECVEHKCRDVIRVHERGWCNRYYFEHFNIPHRHATEFEKRINPICYRYLEGMKWSLLYYQGKHHNWTWYYNYHAAPSITDLAKSLDTFDFDECDFKRSTPVDPFVQLMSILPPESSKLLPRYIGELMTKRDSKLHYMYPLKIELNMLNKRWLWECKPLLPDIDIESIIRIVDHIFYQKYRFDPKLVKRNSIGSTRKFI